MSHYLSSVLFFCLLFSACSPFENNIPSEIAAKTECCQEAYELYINTAKDTLLSDSILVCIDNALQDNAVKNHNLAYGKCLFTKGDEYFTLNDYVNARIKFEAALEEYETTASDSLRYIAECYNRLGIVYDRLANTNLSLWAIDKSIEPYRKIGLDVEVAKAHNNRASTFVSSDEYLKAQAELDKAEHIFKEITISDENTEDLRLAIVNNRGLTLSAEGKNIKNTGNIIGANQSFLQAVKSFKEINRQVGLSPKKAIVNLNIASQYNYLGNGDSIIHYSNKAIKIFDKLTGGLEIPPLAYAYNSRANGHKLNGALKVASKDLIKGLSILGYKINNIKENPTPEIEKISQEKILFSGLKQKAKILDQFYEQTSDKSYLQASLDTYKTALNLLNSMRVQYASDLSAQALTATLISIFADARDIALKMYDLEANQAYLLEALNIVEQGKSYTLRQAVQRNLNTLNYEGKLREIFDKEVLYRNSIVSKRLLGENVVEDVENYRLFIERLKNSASESDEKRYYQDRFDNTPIDIATIQNNLSPTTAILDFSTRGDRIYCFIITAENIDIVDISKMNGKLLDELVKNYKDKLKSGNFGFIDASHRLYTALFSPINKKLDTAIDELIIIPDELIYDLVFDNLITTSPKSQKYNEQDYLLNKYAISYNYSIALFNLSNITKKVTAKLDFAAFITRQKIGIPPNKLRCANSSLTELEKGAEKVTTYFEQKNKLVRKFDPAYEAEYKEEAPTARIIHFATHGCIESTTSSYQFSPLEYNLLFTYDSNSKDADNNILKLSEIRNQTLSATELAVIPSCNTNQSNKDEQIPGEGIPSLTRAFTMAGCPSMIVTMADVLDIGTAAVMDLFYQSLLEGDTIAKALQKAKIQRLEDTNTPPYDWGNIIVVGSNKALF